MADELDEPVELSFQEMFAPGNAFADATQEYADAVTAVTDGMVRFDLHWSNSIVASNEVAGAMNDGLIDMARIQPPASPADFPITNWMAALHNQTTRAFPAGLLQGIGAQLELALESQDLENELESLGIRYIAPIALVQNYDLLCREPIETLDEASDVSVRVAGETWVREAENLGMSPVTLLAEEIYEGYQRGIVDCVMTYPTHYIDSGLWELGGHYVPVSLTGWNQDAITISLDVWRNLPSSVQQEFQEQTRVWINSFVQSQLERYWQFVTQAEEQSVTLISDVPELQARVDEFHEDQRDELAAAAPASLTDPEGFISRHEQLHDKWGDIVEELGFVVDDDFTLEEWVDSLDDPSQPPQIDLGPWLDRLMAEAFG